MRPMEQKRIFRTSWVTCEPKSRPQMTCQEPGYFCSNSILIVLATSLKCSYASPRRPNTVTKLVRGMTRGSALLHLLERVDRDRHGHVRHLLRAPGDERALARDAARDASRGAGRRTSDISLYWVLIGPNSSWSSAVMTMAPSRRSAASLRNVLPPVEKGCCDPRNLDARDFRRCRFLSFRRFARRREEARFYGHCPVQDGHTKRAGSTQQVR